MEDFEESWAEERRQHEQLLAELAAQPGEEIIGILIPGSGDGVQHPWSDRWFIHAGFDAWRVRGGPLRRERLMLNRACSKKHMIELSNALPEETIVAVRARLSERAVPGEPQALLEEVLGPVTDDAELNDELVKLLQPVEHIDAELGKLAFERRYERYSGQILWRGARVELYVAAGKPAPFAANLDVARRLLREQAQWHAAALERAASELLDLKNENWLGDDEDPITREQFRARMKLQGIEVGFEGSVSFWFEDGDLFWGHLICVCGSVGEGLSEADIHG